MTQSGTATSSAIKRKGYYHATPSQFHILLLYTVWIAPSGKARWRWIFGASSCSSGSCTNHQRVLAGFLNQTPDANPGAFFVLFIHQHAPFVRSQEQILFHIPEGVRKPDCLTRQSGGSCNACPGDVRIRLLAVAPPK